jgi:hypothetical protein
VENVFVGDGSFRNERIAGSRALQLACKSESRGSESAGDQERLKVWTLHIELTKLMGRCGAYRRRYISIRTVFGLGCGNKLWHFDGMGRS